MDRLRSLPRRRGLGNALGSVDGDLLKSGEEVVKFAIDHSRDVATHGVGAGHRYQH